MQLQKYFKKNRLATFKTVISKLTYCSTGLFFLAFEEYQKDLLNIASLPSDFNDSATEMYIKWQLCLLSPTGQVGTPDTSLEKARSLVGCFFFLSLRDKVN